MKCLNLIVKTEKIIGEHFSYNKNIEKEMNFQRHVVKIEDVLRLWRMKNLTNEGKVLGFISRITTVPHTIINQLNIIQKNCICNGKNQKIKHSTLPNSYEDGGLKDVDVFSKAISLQFSWIKRLFDEKFHAWKITLSYLTKRNFCEDFRPCLEPTIRSKTY